MINLQPAEKIDHAGPDSIDVVDVYKTIQGEGPFVGTPAVFVRLAGCDLSCKFCDTDYTTNRRRVDVNELVKEVQSKGPLLLVVLTGGEPLRQDISRLVRKLALLGYKIQVETNGTLHQSNVDYGWVHIVCSPKTTRVNLELKPYIRAWKYVLEADNVDPTDGLPTSVLGMDVRPARPWFMKPDNIYVQPVDEQDETKNKRNVDAAIASCMKHGYRLCLQTHKIIGLP